MMKHRRESGGNEELKRSAKDGPIGVETTGAFTTNWAIRYQGFDMGKRSNHSYNYAALQHNNLVFQHARGKSAEFLYKPFEAKKKELYKKLRKGIGRVIK